MIRSFSTIWIKLARSVAFIFSVATCSLSAAKELSPCEGSVLQRRLALVEFGKVVDDYIAVNKVLPNLCGKHVVGISNHVPDLLSKSTICGSLDEKRVYYQCQLDLLLDQKAGTSAQVIEECSYLLADESLRCDNKSVVTSIAPSSEM